MSPTLFFQIFSRSYFLFLVIWLRLVQFQPKIGRKIKIFSLWQTTNILKKKDVCANFRLYALNFFSPSTEQLACPKKPVSPRFNAAWNPTETHFHPVESFYGGLVLLCGTKSHNGLSTTIPNIIMTVKMFLMIRADREGIDFNLKMKRRAVRISNVTQFYSEEIV